MTWAELIVETILLDMSLQDGRERDWQLLDTPTDVRDPIDNGSPET